MKSLHLAVEGKKVVFSHNGKVPILDGLIIKVKKGHIYGLLGPSGCGKTTLLRCILGRLQPQSGEIRIYGRKPGESGFCIPGRGVGYMPQELALHSDVTVEETLWYFGRLFNMSHDQINERISFLIDLLKIPDKKSLIQNLSGGQMRRVSFAAALIHNPPLLILDEPTVGVDPVLRQNIWTHLKTLATEDRVTIIITTHYVEEARHADMVGLMRNGYLLTEENPVKLIELHELNSLEEVFLKLSTENDSFSLKAASTETLETITDSSMGDSCLSISTNVEENLSSSMNHQNTPSPQAIEFNILTKGNSHNSSACSKEDIHTLLHHTESKSEQCKKCLHRMNALLNKSCIQLKRNIPLTAFQLCVPAIQIVLFCIFIGQNPRDLPIAVVNMEIEQGFSQKFLERIDNKTIIQTPYSNLSLAINSVKSGKTWGALYIGETFTSSLLERFVAGNAITNETISASSIELHLDMTNQQITFAIQRSIIESFQDFAEEMLVATSQNPLLAKSPIVFADPIYGSKDTTFMEFVAPNMLLTINYFMAISLTAMSIVLEKKQGLLECSMVAGVQCSEILFTILLTMFSVMFVQVILVLVVLLSVFQIPVHGSVIWVSICVLVSGVGGMALGLFLSAVSHDEHVAIMLTMSVYTPSFILSGIIWPIESMAFYLKYICYCMPLTLLTETMRSILSRGWSVTDNYIWIGFVVSLAWIVLFVVLAGLIFKRK